MAMHMRLWCPSPSPFVASNLQKKKQKKNCLKIKGFLQYSSSNQVRMELINPGKCHPS